MTCRLLCLVVRKPFGATRDASLLPVDVRCIDFAGVDHGWFASCGIPSTSVSVAYDFADYHRSSDEWRKLDYENMARVDRAIALAVYGLADGVVEPRWNAKNPQTERYRRAR